MDYPGEDEDSRMKDLQDSEISGSVRSKKEKGKKGHASMIHAKFHPAMSSGIIDYPGEDGYFSAKVLREARKLL